MNVKFDMEKGEGKELSKQFKIRAYPTFLLFESGGRKRIGLLEAENSRVHSSGKERFAERKYIGGIGKEYKTGKMTKKRTLITC